MKKLMVAAAIVVTAACTHAAAFTWTVAKMYAPTASSLAPAVADTSLLSRGSAQLYYALALNGDDTVWTALGEAKSISSGTTGSITAFDASSIPTAIADNSNTAYFKVVVDTTVGGKDYTMELIEGTLTEPASTSFANLGKTKVTKSFSGITSATQTKAWTAVATPEPTSALLMLIGMAGLALRRRRA